MNLSVKSTTSAFLLSFLLLGSASTALIFLSADSVIAKNNNTNNGNGNNGNGNNGGNRGNRGNNGNANNNSNSGNSAASSGALNAAHANANAQANTASNSRVGLIQAYEAAVIATSVAKQEYETALAAWSEFSNFESRFDSYSDFAIAYNNNPAGLEDELAYWRASTALSTTNSDLNASQEIEDMALQLAANKETDEATIARLWDLLGL